MTALRKLLALGKALPLALEVAAWIVDETKDLHETRMRLARKARKGDLNDSIARLRALTKD